MRRGSTCRICPRCPRSCSPRYRPASMSYASRSWRSSGEGAGARAIWSATPPTSLERFYTHLNLVDPGAGGHRSANRWGGSTEIGGSPRATGTRLAPEQIARVCQQAFRPPALVQRLRRIAGAALGSAGILLAALASAFLPGLIGRGAGAPSGLAASPAQFSVLLVTLGGALLLIRGLRAPGLYGLRRPA